MNKNLQVVDRELSVGELFRLVEIANNTPHLDVRKAALYVFERATQPPPIVQFTGGIVAGALGGQAR